MLLNEYRLQPWTREAQEFLVEQMNGSSSARGKAARCRRSMWRRRTRAARTRGATLKGCGLVYT